MIPSVSPEADWKLSKGANFYAREANAKVGLAFISEVIAFALPEIRNSVDLDQTVVNKLRRATRHLVEYGAYSV